VVHHAERLRLEGNRAGLAFCADTLGPLRMTRRAVPLDAVVRLDERRDEGTTKLGLVGGRVDLAHIRMNRHVLDLLLLQVLRVKWVQGCAVVAHALRPVPAHGAPLSWNLAIELV